MSFASRLAAAGLLAGALLIAPVQAQQDTTTSNAATPDTGTATTTITATNPGTWTAVTRYVDDRRGFNWGWLGLLGLAGLLGLRKPANGTYYWGRERTYQDRTPTR